MITATFRGQVIACSEDTVYLEGNHYFPPSSIMPDTLEDSWVRTLCFWKGLARYHHVRAGGEHRQRRPAIGSVIRSGHFGTAATVFVSALRSGPQEALSVP